MTQTSAGPDTFDWLRYPDAEAYVAGRLDEFVTAIPTVQGLAEILIARTGGRLVDWLDHLELADGDLPRGQLAELGFEQARILLADVLSSGY